MTDRKIYSYIIIPIIFFIGIVTGFNMKKGYKDIINEDEEKVPIEVLRLLDIGVVDNYARVYTSDKQYFFYKGTKEHEIKDGEEIFCFSILNNK